MAIAYRKHTSNIHRRCVAPRAGPVLLRGGRVRPEDAPDGSADFHRASEPDTDIHGLHFRLRKPAGVRAHAAPPGPGRLVALSHGESWLSVDTRTLGLLFG